MPAFDIVSKVDLQEVRNAVDQANREIVNRFDFKGTNTTITISDGDIAVEYPVAGPGRLTTVVAIVAARTFSSAG